MNVFVYAVGIKNEKNHCSIETLTAFVTTDIQWVEQRKEWKNLKCMKAIRAEFTSKKVTSSQWHYYISSRQLTAEELLHHTRMKWSVESMYWLLDIHFEEDWCRIKNKAYKIKCLLFWTCLFHRVHFS